MKHTIRTRRFITAFIFVALLALVGGWSLFAGSASAEPQIIGNPHGANLRVVERAPAANGSVKRIVYFTSGVITPVSVGGTVTPVTNSAAICGQGAASIYRADVYAVGTMTGTAPTLALTWQNSIDGGVTWTTVGAFTTINATVTPASQSQVVSDVVGSTAVAFGDCWRFKLTFGGTGSVGANIEVVGLSK